RWVPGSAGSDGGGGPGSGVQRFRGREGVRGAVQSRHGGVKGGESEQAPSASSRTGAVNLLSSPQKVVSEKGEAVMKRILGYLKDERGIETLEWIAMGALILGVAFVVYPGTLQPALTTLVGTIATALGTIALP